MDSNLFTVLIGISGTFLGSATTYLTSSFNYKSKIKEIENNNWVSLVKDYNNMNVSLRIQIDCLNKRIDSLEKENIQMRKVMLENGILQSTPDIIS